MNDREKLIEVLLRGCRETADKNAVPLCSEEYCKENREYCFGDLVSLLISNGVTFETDNHVGGKWIPVTERLPKADDGDVLVVKNYRGKTYVDIGEIIEGEAYCCSDDYAIHPREHKLTHWMPLPEPPKEGE